MKITHAQGTTFNWLEVESAVCLIEAMCDMEAAHLAGKTHDNAVTGEKLLELRGEHGSFTLRAAIASLADDCHDAWVAAEALGYDDSFDFDFCTAFLRGAVESGLLAKALDWQYKPADSIRLELLKAAA